MKLRHIFSYSFIIFMLSAVILNAQVYDHNTYIKKDLDKILNSKISDILSKLSNGSGIIFHIDVNLNKKTNSDEVSRELGSQWPFENSSSLDFLPGLSTPNPRFMKVEKVYKAQTYDYQKLINSVNVQVFSAPEFKDKSIYLASLLIALELPHLKKNQINITHKASDFLNFNTEKLNNTSSSTDKIEPYYFLPFLGKKLEFILLVLLVSLIVIVSTILLTLKKLNSINKDMFQNNIDKKEDNKPLFETPPPLPFNHLPPLPDETRAANVSGSENSSSEQRFLRNEIKSIFLENKQASTNIIRVLLESRSFTLLSAFVDCAEIDFTSFGKVNSLLGKKFESFFREKLSRNEELSASSSHQKLLNYLRIAKVSITELEKRLILEKIDELSESELKSVFAKKNKLASIISILKFPHTSFLINEGIIDRKVLSKQSYNRSDFIHFFQKSSTQSSLSIEDKLDLDYNFFDSDINNHFDKIVWFCRDLQINDLIHLLGSFTNELRDRVLKELPEIVSERVKFQGVQIGIASYIVREKLLMFLTINEDNSGEVLKNDFNKEYKIG